MLFKELGKENTNSIRLKIIRKYAKGKLRYRKFSKISVLKMKKKMKKNGVKKRKMKTKTLVTLVIVAILGVLLICGV